MRQLAAAISVVLGAALAASPAVAAFPGRNGLLAVAPLNGAGIVLVKPGGGSERRICTMAPRCRIVRSPRWSPDGQALAFSSSRGGVSLMYPDGTCLDCEPFSGSGAAFTTTPGVLTAASGGNLVRYGIDGVAKATVMQSYVWDAVWSARGRLAVVDDGNVLIGRESLGFGSGPSWSPDGSRLAFSHAGWVIVVHVRKRPVETRLVRGTAPAWSPDGRSIAFIAAGHRLSVVPARGGRVRSVGHVLGRSVDWQPITAKPAAKCVAAPGSKTMAQSSTAIVTTDIASGGDGISSPGNAYMGCLLSTGRERLLRRYGIQNIDGMTSASEAATAGDYAALLDSFLDDKYGGSSSTVLVFDLRTGTLDPARGGENVGCQEQGYQCGSAADGLVLDADGFSAVHTTLIASSESGPDTEELERIVADDGAGVRVLDSSTSHYLGSDPPAQLTGLALFRDTLTWNHAGTPESAQLH